jgi:dipeptidyl aminopeptidase/acylaminoacyl peptidase
MSLAADFVFDNQSFGGSLFPHENAEGLEKWNPAKPELLREWKTPMLICHSDRDYRCTIDTAFAAFTTCQALDVPSRLLNYPDEVSALFSFPQAY